MLLTGEGGRAWTHASWRMSSGTTFPGSRWRWAGNQGPGPGLLTCRVAWDKSIQLSGPQCESPLVSGEGVTVCPPASPRRLASPGVGGSHPGGRCCYCYSLKSHSSLSLHVSLGLRRRWPQSARISAAQKCPSAGRATFPRKRTPSGFTIAIRNGLLNTTS